VSCIPCKSDDATRAQIDEIAEILKTHAHTISHLGMTERELYETGLFRGAIERIRGQFAASMYEKRTFAKIVLNYLEDSGQIASWSPAEGANRYNYDIQMPSGRRVAVAMKGCLDGNNTNIFERPAEADEFFIWSVCMNAGASPPRNAWSGIHSRLAPEMLTTDRLVDGLIIWDMVCGTIGRPCPKLAAAPGRIVEVGPYRLPPPCTYVFPAVGAHPQNMPLAKPQPREGLSFLTALDACFGSYSDEGYSVALEARIRDGSLERLTRVYRDGNEVQTSEWTRMRRS
jgi:hypothetical protein